MLFKSKTQYMFAETLILHNISNINKYAKQYPK